MNTHMHAHVRGHTHTHILQYHVIKLQDRNKTTICRDWDAGKMTGFQKVLISKLPQCLLISLSREVNMRKRTANTLHYLSTFLKTYTPNRPCSADLLYFEEWLITRSTFIPDDWWNTQPFQTNSTFQSCSQTDREWPEESKSQTSFLILRCSLCLSCKWATISSILYVVQIKWSLSTVDV